MTKTQLVKAPGQDGDIFLKRGTPVELERPTGSRLLRYVDEGGYQFLAGEVGNGKPYVWGVARIVRVFAEDKPTQEPDLPRPIEPEDVRVGMMVERRKGDAAMRDRVQKIDGERIVGTDWPWLWIPVHAAAGWSLWLVEDQPEPVDPDAAVIEKMARAAHGLNCAEGWHDWDKHDESARELWRNEARATLSLLRETHVVTPRTEQ